jgi:hypothetical protein
VSIENLIDKLPCADNAIFNALSEQHKDTCLPDTRVDLLRDIYTWADGRGERFIFWLNGMAGTGKSTIARTVARKYFEQGHLAASFFFSRGGGDDSHAGLFFPTIARELAKISGTLHEHINDALRENSKIASQAYSDQWRQLILGPLRRFEKDATPSTYVIVVDALDECNNSDDIEIILRLMAEARDLKRIRLRILLTSRPEIPIRHGFEEIPETEHRDFVLHKISPSIVDRDISIFLEYKLRQIERKHSLGASWPGPKILDQMVQNAGGLFIWAATACRFISEGAFAEERLCIVLGKSQSTAPQDNDGAHVVLVQKLIKRLIWDTGLLFIWIIILCGFIRDEGFLKDQLYAFLNSGPVTPNHSLNGIYTAVLRSCIRTNYTEQEKKRFCRMLRIVLGAIVTQFSPLSAKSLNKLLRQPVKEEILELSVEHTIKDLHAILDIPDNDFEPIRLHHPSFRDFLLDRDRCRDSSFWVDKSKTHQALAARCIQLLSCCLIDDICEVVIPGKLVTEVGQSQIQQCLPPEVQYACLYWIQHVQKGGVQLHDDDFVHQFLKIHVLHWLEAMSWMGKISDGIRDITLLESIVNVSVDRLTCVQRTELL